MRICGVSDLHGVLDINTPACDILCICGDFVPLAIQKNNEQSEIWLKTKFVDWVNQLNCKKVILIAGNHDFILYRKYLDNTLDSLIIELQELTNNKLIYLQDSSYKYDGITFYGTPWIKPITFQHNKWAFESNDEFNKIQDCDILLTHDTYDNPLLAEESIKKAKYHFYGHWHTCNSYSNIGRYNVSILDDYYNLQVGKAIITIDIMSDSEKEKIEQAFLAKIRLSVDTWEGQGVNVRADVKSFLDRFKISEKAIKKD